MAVKKPETGLWPSAVSRAEHSAWQQQLLTRFRSFSTNSSRFRCNRRSVSNIGSGSINRSLPVSVLCWRALRQWLTLLVWVRIVARAAAVAGCLRPRPPSASLSKGIEKRPERIEEEDRHNRWKKRTKGIGCRLKKRWRKKEKKKGKTKKPTGRPTNANAFLSKPLPLSWPGKVCLFSCPPSALSWAYRGQLLSSSQHCLRSLLAISSTVQPLSETSPSAALTANAESH